MVKQLYELKYVTSGSICSHMALLYVFIFLRSTLHMLEISYSKEITIWEGDFENYIFEVYMVNIQIKILYGIFLQL